MKYLHTIKGVFRRKVTTVCKKKGEKKEHWQKISYFANFFYSYDLGGGMGR